MKYLRLINNKINNIIIPHHDSLTISPLSVLLNLNEKEYDKKGGVAEKEALNENKNLIKKEEKIESEEEEEAEILNENEEKEIVIEEANEHNLVEEMTGENIDNLDNFWFNMMLLLNGNQYKDLEKEIENKITKNRKNTVK